MQRDAIEQLIFWKNNPRRKPLLLLGARKVGKTWLMQEFGRRQFKKVAYIRFDLNDRLRASFEQDYNIPRLLEVIQLDAGLIHKVVRISKPAFPADAYRESSLKVFFLDVGLLGAKSNLPVSAVLDGNRIFTEFKGALAEQYVQQEIRACCAVTPYYWTTPNSQSEIDFLVQMGLDMVPLEVKAEPNLQAKSLKAFCKKFRCASAIRASMASWCVQDMPIDAEGASCKLINLPLYAVSQIMKLGRYTLA